LKKSRKDLSRKLEEKIFEIGGACLSSSAMSGNITPNPSLYYELGNPYPYSDMLRTGGLLKLIIE